LLRQGRLWLNLAVNIPGKLPAPSIVMLMVMSGFLLASASPGFAQRNAKERPPAPMKRAPAGTNEVRWHTITLTPKANAPEIHFYNKLNPVWWLQNADDPVPPASYRPDDPHRLTKWHFRNPLHNFTFYVIGVADKPTTRSGRYPERIANPNGGWNFAVARRRIVLLPFVSYERKYCSFYLGWRNRGSFGIKLNLHSQLKPKPARKSGKTLPPENPQPQAVLPGQPH
jgi:hypothetical protein